MVLGIDLGTSNTLAATLTRDGHPVPIPDVTSRRLSTPSLLLIDHKSALAGHLAEQWLELHPDRQGIRSYKRYFGTHQPVFVDGRANPWFSETLAAIMLRKIRHDAEMTQPDPVRQVVVTVPAHYNDAQRRSVLEAARLAGLPPTALIEEPVAAALGYLGTSPHDDEVVLVYDFGGGTFDLTLVTRTGDQVHVLAKDGLSTLGGKEFDDLIAGRVAAEYQRCVGEPLPTDRRLSHQLPRLAERFKLELCAPGNGWLSRWLVLGHHAFEFTMSLGELEALAAGLLARTQAVTDRCLRSVGITLADVHKVVMVGGTSYLPFLKTGWERRLTAQQELIFYDPLNAVARGAALYAGSLYADGSNLRPLVLKTVSTYHIALRRGQAAPDVLIRKNSPLPVQARRRYTLIPGTTLHLTLIQYWDEDEATALGTLRIGPYANSLEMELLVENRSNGTIGLKLQQVTTGKEVKLDFTRTQADQHYDAASQQALLDELVINSIP